MDNNTLTLEEFIQKTTKELDEFKSYWIENQKKQGKNIYPEKISEAVWLEQFFSYRSTESII